MLRRSKEQKKISGQHKDFVNFVEEAVADDLLNQIGDCNLMNTSFTQLPKEVFKDSMIKTDTVSPLSAADSSSKSKNTTFGECLVATLNLFQKQNSSMNI